MPDRPRIRRRTPWVAVAGLVLLAGSAAAASALTASAHSASGPEVPSTVPAPTVPTSTVPTTTGPPGSSIPAPVPPSPTLTLPTTVPYSPPPPGALSTRIELPSRTLVAGSTVDGALVVSDHTDRSYNLTQGCRPYWAVGLQSATIPFNPAVPAICGLAPFWIHPGDNRLPFTLIVRYQACSSGSQGTAGTTLPPCGDAGALPPLPPGTYQVVLVSGSPALSAPAVDVVVVPSPGGG